DLLLKYKFWISGEYYLRIKHALIGAPGAKISQITEVHSHPVALAQCEEFLDTTLSRAERFESHDTAGSVAALATDKKPRQAAIASVAAAKLYEMAVLKEGIETNKQNYTRFIALDAKQSIADNSNKTSVVMEAANTPGSLYRALGVFADKDMNLSKLESRPIIGKAWHYMFYIDFEAGLEEERTNSALKILEEMDNRVQVLGSYQKHSLL
ncbi:MAG: prephenate dehydratase domain-containing protein, partial [Candidatus Saccharimonadales bacterium]|nr:prephenate dehydratase domain-containing protein [Candidatus Saccharimonadales bacterium]